MIRILLISFLIVQSFFHEVKAQHEWQLIRAVPQKAFDAWDVDPMGKVIFARRDVLTKLDTSFNVEFTQSLKSFGNVTKIDARHALKSLIFSEDQQAIAFIDNTLTMHKGLKDLTAIDVSFSTTASYSAQSSRYWVFDGDNSKLVLIDELKSRPQVLENLAGLVGAPEIHEILEIENTLFLLDKSQGIYLFDIYGSFIDFIPVQNVIGMHYTDNFLFYLTDKTLNRMNLRNRRTRSFELPEENVNSFRVLGNYVFLKTPQHLKKYELR